jgi:nucleoside-diphosphate-sugar epimerase
MRVAVLGGTIFIGRAIVEALVDGGHQVLVCHRGDHEPEGPPFGQVRHLHCDRAALSDHRSELDDFGPEAMVDCRALGRADSETVLAAFDPGIRKVVLSSMDVYEAITGLTTEQVLSPVPLTENAPVRTERFPYRGRVPGMDDYDKLDVEDVYCGRGGVSLRLPMVSGPFDYQRREEPFLRRVRAGRKAIPVGAGTWLNSRGYVHDIGQATRLAVEAPARGVEGEVFNICEEFTWPMAVVAREILEAAGSSAELVRVRDDVIPEDLGLTGAVTQHFLASAEKARRVLGYTDTPREEAMKATVSWHLDNPPKLPEGSEDPGFEADDTALASV